MAGRVGTGLVVAKTEEGVWSAPSAIATLGMGWGALIGGEITDFVLVLNTDAALEAFSGMYIGTTGCGPQRRREGREIVFFSFWCPCPCCVGGERPNLG